MPTLDTTEKFKKYIFWIFRALLIVTAIIAVFSHHWKEVMYLLFILFLTFLPRIIEGKVGLDYPSEIEIIILLFIIASIYLGEMHSFYEKFPWWDVLLHSISAVIIGGIGFSIVFILNKSKKIVFKLSPGFVCLFAFCFAVAFGALWEIFEYMMDQAFGLNMQKSGLVDTMEDLIVDSLGALVFAVFGYFHLKRKIHMFDWLARKFFKLNPELKETSQENL